MVCVAAKAARDAERRREGALGMSDRDLPPMPQAVAGDCSAPCSFLFSSPSGSLSAVFDRRQNGPHTVSGGAYAQSIGGWGLCRHRARRTLSRHVQAKTYGRLALRHGEFDAPKTRSGQGRDEYEQRPLALAIRLRRPRMPRVRPRPRKLGFEALDREERSLGLFSTQREAAAAIMLGSP